MARSLVDLKKEATDLGIAFEDSVKATELQAMIDKHYESSETSQTELQNTIAQLESGEVKDTPVKQVSLGALAVEAEKAARKTKVIVIHDNDIRENNNTTLAVVNCSNQYFDLGTVNLPLNEPIEVMQGHIDALREVEIPHHSPDPRNGTTRATLRKRYSIDVQ